MPSSWPARAACSTPTRPKDATRPRTTRSKPISPSGGEVRKALAPATKRDAEIADAVTVLVSTGMRRGELLALRWSDVDLKKEEVHVDATITDGGRGVGILRKPTKRADWRDVPLTSGAVDALWWRCPPSPVELQACSSRAVRMRSRSLDGRLIGMTESSTARAEFLKKADLIPDARLREGEPDAFHLPIAARVAELAVHAEAPVNIALFGPWGSGKSSFFELLRSGLEQRDRGIVLVRYDAWKYGGGALKRNFCQQRPKTDPFPPVEI